LNKLGIAAVTGMRERAGKSDSAEANDRAKTFLARFDQGDTTPGRIRYLRSLDILAALNTSQSRTLMESLADGPAGVWETDAARQAITTP